MAFRQADALIVYQAGVFDRVDAGEDRVSDRRCTVGVRGDPPTELVGFVDDRLHFFQRVLLGARLIAFAEHAARRADLDDVCAVLDDLANLRADRPWAIGDSVRRVVKFDREEIAVAVPASDPKRRPGHDHARTLDVARVDAVSQRDVGEIGGHQDFEPS